MQTISKATDTKITIAVDLEPALGATIDYLADRWETKNPAPRDVLLATIKDTLEHLIKDMLIDDWSWYLENDRTVAKIEETVQAELDRRRPMTQNRLGGFYK